MAPVRDLHVVEPDRATARLVSAWAGVRVPEGHTVATGYVPIHDVVIHAPRGQHLDPAEVERATAGSSSSAPTKRGRRPPGTGARTAGSSSPTGATATLPRSCSGWTTCWSPGSSRLIANARR